MRRVQDQLRDELLVLRCQSRDAAAFDELVTRWHRRLQRFAFHVTGDPDAAYDAVQDAWLAMVNGINRLNDVSLFPQWAYRIVHRKCLDWIRGRQRGRKVRERLKNDAPSSETVTSPNAREERLAIALGELSSEQRTLVSLYYFEELSVGDIAEVVGIAAGTVKSRLFACRNELRRKLEEEKPC